MFTSALPFDDPEGELEGVRRPVVLADRLVHQGAIVVVPRGRERGQAREVGLERLKIPLRDEREELLREDRRARRAAREASLVGNLV